MKNRRLITGLALVLFPRGIVLCQQDADNVNRKPIGEPITLTKSADLAAPQNWADSVVQLVAPKSPTSSGTTETLPARVIRYDIPSGGLRLYGLIFDPHTKFTYVVHAGQSFYISTASDMISGMLGPGALRLRHSIFRISTSARDDARAIEYFSSDVDNQKLIENDESQKVVDLEFGTPFQFWTKDSLGGSQGATPSITGLNLSDGVLKLDLMSDGGKYTGTFWIDIKLGKLLNKTVSKEGVLIVAQTSDVDSVGKDISCKLAPNSVTVHSGTPIVLQIGLHNGSKKRIRYDFSDPRFTVDFHIESKEAGAIACKPVANTSSVGARNNGFDVDPGQERFQQVKLEDWGCPALKVGTYEVSAAWNFEDDLYDNKESPVIHMLPVPSLKSNIITLTVAK